MSYLLIGGPAHGQEREIDNGESSLTIWAPFPDNPVPTPIKYWLQEIEAETRPGMTYRRKVLIAENLPLEVASQALGSVLLQRFAEELLRQFMEGGVLVGNRTIDTGTDSSGLLTASR